MDALIRDLRTAFRSFVRKPGFTAVAVLTIALGIGASTAIFTVVNAVLLQPLPYPDPDGLVMVWEKETARGWDRVPVSAEDYRSWRRQATSFRALAAGSPRSFALSGEGEPEQVPGMAVTWEFFRVFGVRPALGRAFGPDANVEGNHRVAVLSHGLWDRRYGADPAVVGRTVRLGGEPFEVVGVMPDGFRFPSTAQLWTPLVFQEAQLQDRNWHFLTVVGRLAEGTGVEVARAEMGALASRLAEEFPESNGGWDAEVYPLHGEMTQGVRSMLWLLSGAVGFVLLIACANVANLLLVRASGRTREMALRSVLGAGKGRLVGQLLTESLLLAGMGAVLGVLGARLGLDALLALSPVTVPGGGEVTMDGTVLGVTAAGALLTGLVFGAAPALVVWRTDLQPTLRAGDRSQAGDGGRRIRSGLVVAEVAVALILVTGAGLMLQSLGRLTDVDVGVRTENLLLAPFSLPEASYPSPAERTRFYDELVARAAALPGVESAALSRWLPPQSGPQFHHRIEGVHDAWTMDLPVARVRAVTPGYFETMGIPLLRGRTFTKEDRGDAARVVVVDQAFVDEHFGDQDPLGQRIRALDDEPREIVGVVGKVANAGLLNDPQPTDYHPLAQDVLGGPQTLVLRTTGRPSALNRPVQDLIWSLDPDLPLLGLTTLEDQLSGAMAQPRFQSFLLAVFAALALVLAAVGIYGVMAVAVTERTAELGLRMALGATGEEVRGLVLRRALRLTAAGVVLGLIGSLALTRFIAGFLFQGEARDPLVYAGVTVVLSLVALAAGWLPALRASRLDPLAALRTD